jgi:hypothetical protein
MPVAEQRELWRKAGPLANTKFHTIEEKAAAQRAHADKWKRTNRPMQRDIGEFPLDINWERRLACKANLRLFNETYLKGIFSKEWSTDQLVCVNKAQTVVMEGGKFAIAMPRAGGKTAIVRGATLWAVLYALKRFIYNIGSKEQMALQTLKMVKTHLVNNPLVRQDFPEVCWAAYQLEGSNRLSRGQLFLGQPTHINWGDDDVRFPILSFPTEYRDHYLEHDPESVKHVEHLNIWVPTNGGVILRSAGIDGSIRGEAEADPVWLTQPRPDLVILDDVQKDQKADSPLLCEKLIRLIDGAVAGLAGEGRHIDVLMPCTVIREGDAADTYLNPLLKPDFQGERCRMVNSWPEGITDYEITKNTPAGKKWGEYEELRRVSLRDKKNISLATEFYAKPANRKVMDKGFEVSWASRFDTRSEISAQQNAMNLRLQLGPMFLSEYQNIGRRLVETSEVLITADQLLKKMVDTKRGELAPNHEYVTCFLDIQDEILYYVVFACDVDFNGTFIDYGTWPDTKHSYFTKQQTSSWSMITSLFFQQPEFMKYRSKAIRNSAGKVRAPLEAKLYYALNQCTTMLLGREYIRQDSSKRRMKIQRLGIDTRWGQASEVIKRFIRETKNPHIVPYYGAAFPPTNRQLEEYERRDGWFFENMLHPNVREPKWVTRPNPDGMYYMQADVNRLKDFLFSRLGTPMGAPGCVSLHSAPADYHELFVNHICSSEYPEPVGARGIVKNQWTVREGTAYDNDWLDGAAGCMALASSLGASVKTSDEDFKPIRRNLSQVYNSRRGASVPSNRPHKLRA